MGISISASEELKFIHFCPLVIKLTQGASYHYYMMKQASKLLKVSVELALVCVLILATFALFSIINSRGQSTDQQEGYPPPVTTQAPTLQPTSTTQPTPTATQKPLPTSTGLPLPTPPTSPSGIIRYTIISGEAPNFIYSHFALVIDSDALLNLVKPEPIPLPDLGFNPSQIFVSPNERYVVAMLPIEPGGQPYVIDQNTDEIKSPLSDFAPGQFQGWHPDNRQFLFVVDGGGPWLVNAETSEVNQLVFDGSNHGAAISPDGQKVAYIGSNPIGGSLYGLWLINSSGGEAEFQGDVSSIAQLYPGAWSPNAQWVAYYGGCSSETQSGPVCLFNPVTREYVKLSVPSFGGTRPVWSPNGQYLAVTGLVRGEKFCEGDNLSPLEQEACEFDDGHIIYIVDISKNEASPLTSGIAPTWSPDGSILAFISKRTSATEIWTIQVDGNNLQQLTVDGQYKDPFNITWAVEVGQ